MTSEHRPDTTPGLPADAPTLDTPAPEATFADCGVSPDIVAALAHAGITQPFPIQALTLPLALSGQDIIGHAKTGTGKTLGFGIPVIQGTPQTAHAERAAGTPRALIVVPTRELATQVGHDLCTAASNRPCRISVLYGGQAFAPQISELAAGVDIVVGTPGRLLDLQRQNHLHLNAVTMAVLDEADELLDLGFLPDVETLLKHTNEQRQTMLFSATLPTPVLTMARQYMNQPTHIRASGPEECATKPEIRQLAYRAHALDKDELIARVLQASDRGRTIIFTRTKRAADRLSAELADRGFAATAIHGDLQQSAREKALKAFRNHQADVLVATDVAARGIDIDDVTHVINAQCPEDENTYVHRIGRTGRAGNTGIAITLVDWEDLHRWALIDKALGLGQTEPPETYSSSTHLREDLGIPEEARGRLTPQTRTRAAGHKGANTANAKRAEPGRKAQRPRAASTPAAEAGRSRRRRTRGNNGTAAAKPAPETGQHPQPSTSGAGKAAPGSRRRRRSHQSEPPSQQAHADARQQEPQPI